MKIHTLLYTLPSLLAVGSAYADISMGRPAAPQAAAQGAYHADLLASNVVHAALKEIRDVPVVSLESATPTTAQMAVFEVKQNLAHRRYDRMGDAALQPAKLFPVSLASDVPGQDAALAEKIRAMKPGDEAIMKIDHIYIFREDGNENVRACTRFEKAEPRDDSATETAPPATDVATSAPAPAATSTPAAIVQPTPGVLSPRGSNTMPNFGTGGNRLSGSSVESRITMEPDGQGGMRRKKVEIHREWTASSETIRKFIDDVEVDPKTDQPLASPAPASPTAAEESAPGAQAKEQDKQLPPIPEPPAEPGDGF